MTPRIRRFLLPAVLGLLAALTLGAPAAYAAKKGKDGPAGGDSPEKPDKPYAEWKKTLKDAESMKGYFTLYKKRENLYLEISKDQLEKPFLGVFSCARGIGSNFMLGGLPLGDHLLQLERAGDHVMLIEVNSRFTAPAGSPIEQARELSHGNSVLASMKIESENDSSKAILVDLAPVLLSDFADLAENMRGALGKPVRFDKERSALGKLKNFPDNTELEALLTFSPNDRMGLNVPSVPDERFVPITVHYSFCRLPEPAMKPRYADDRVGYFLTAVKDFGRDDRENFWMRYANRWRLEKKDPSAALSEPVKPIVYYIDHTVPEKYRPWVKEGVEKWQKAFEAAGFKNAILAKDAPDDASWDPEDVRYSSIRWIVSSEPSFGAIGPSRVDPRTGEIFDADILFEAAMLQNYRNAYRRYAGPEALAASILPALDPATAWLPPELRCELATGVEDGGGLLHADLLLNGMLPPGAPVPDEFMHEMLVWAVMHEVGHTLGLRHNFRSSTSTPRDHLWDTAWTRDHGLTGSVMEYPSPNIAYDKAKPGDYYTTTPGTYDLWAIRYGYTPSGAATPDADAVFATKIAGESNQPGHEYSTDEDTYPSDALDPRANIYDLGDDPLQFAKDRTAYIAGLWKQPKIEERIVGPTDDYTVLRRAMDTLLGQYGIALGMAVKYVGGSYNARNHRGDASERDALTPVTAARQREAVDFLGSRAFAADAFAMNPALLNRMAPDRWSHWGMQNAFAGQRLDYNLNDKSLAIQTTLLNALTAPALMSRVREQEARMTEPYRLAEHFDRLTRTLWGEVGGGVASASTFRALEGTGTRRELQRTYVDRLSAMVTSPLPGAPDDARALARLQLTRIDARAARVLAAPAAIGDYTRAHLLESRARIKRALDASTEADPAGGARATSHALPAAEAMQK